MPPKTKKVGRPIGSKNKKKSAAYALTLQAIKTEEGKMKNIKKEETPGDGSESDSSEYVVPVLQEDSNNVADGSFTNENNEPEDTYLSIRNIEANKVIYNCKKCTNKNFKFEENYRQHILMEHSTTPGSVGCSQCPVVCPNQETLDAHVAKVHDRSVFKCKHCGKEFVRQAHVLRHMAQKGCDGSRVSLYPCEICKAKFTRKDNLIVHLRSMHIRRMVYNCKQPDCSFASKNLTKLIRHWHHYHAEEPRKFVCHHCGKCTMSRAAIAKHLEIHGEKKYSCDVCGYSTYTIEVMRRHILTHVEDKPYKCKVCGLSYIQRSQLERHAEKHVGKVARCCDCGDTFDTKAKLLLHKRRKHEKVTANTCPYKECNHSNKPFLTETQLLNHINKHLQQKNPTWLCEVCKKSFPSEINMRRHLSTHTLDRPRRCMYCVSARAYVRGQQLVRHVRKFHADVFHAHLAHVRNVLVTNPKSDRVTKSELESILTLLDAESERILEGCGGADVLYGGMQPASDARHDSEDEEDSPLMSEEVLANNLGNLLQHLIDKETLLCLGWPDEPIDDILERVIEQCGARPADRDKWSRVQCLRENAKHLFLYVVDDKNVSMMLSTHTIDQIVKHILAQAAGDAAPDAAATATGAPADHPPHIEIEISVT